MELETPKNYIKTWPIDLSGLPSHRPELRSCSFVRETESWPRQSEKRASSGELREGDKLKTFLRTRYGHLEYQVMPFGLSKASATVQGYVTKILAEKLDIFVIVYSNDILIYTEDPGQPHVEAVRCVLDQLRKQSLFANLKKCRFHQDEVRFLGYVVSFKGISMEAERIEAIKDWSESVSMKHSNFHRLRRFLSTIHPFSRIATPLTLMLKATGSSEVSIPRALGVDDDEADGVGGSGDESPR